MLSQHENQMPAPTSIPIFPKWINKIGHLLMDLIYFLASGFCISAFWHYILVPTGLRDLSVGQTFALVWLGRFIQGSVTRLTRTVQTADKQNIESKMAFWKSVEVLRMCLYGAFLALYLWLTNHL